MPCLRKTIKINMNDIIFPWDASISWFKMHFYFVKIFHTTLRKNLCFLLFLWNTAFITILHLEAPIFFCSVYYSFKTFSFADLCFEWAVNYAQKIHSKKHLVIPSVLASNWYWCLKIFKGSNLHLFILPMLSANP